MADEIFNDEVLALVRAWLSKSTLVVRPDSSVRFTYVKSNMLSLKIIGCTPFHAVELTSALHALKLQVKFFKTDKHALEMYCNIFKKRRCLCF